MSEKRSEQATILLRLDDLSYFIIDLAVPYWKKYADGNDKSRQGLIRKAATAFATQILKAEGVYDKAIENFKLEESGKAILEERKVVEEKIANLDDMELP
jgi:hypothetical protein